MIEDEEESMERVYAVDFGSWFSETICGSWRELASWEGIGAQIRPLQFIVHVVSCILVLGIPFPPSPNFHSFFPTSGELEFGSGGYVPGMPDHEGHLLLADMFRGDDQVAFVLAVRRVEDYYELAPACPSESAACVHCAGYTAESSGVPPVTHGTLRRCLLCCRSDASTPH